MTSQGNNMDYYQLSLFGKSWIARAISVLLLISYILIAVLIQSIPQGVRFIPAHMVESNNVYFQPVEIVATESYGIFKEGLRVNRFTISTPGRYSYNLIDAFGNQQTISFRVYVYDSSLNVIIFAAAIAPAVLLIYSFKGGKYDSTK
jgi:hypothetical protein